MMSITIERPYAHLKEELLEAFAGQEDVKVVVDRPSSDRFTQLQELVQATLADVNSKMSHYEEDSEVFEPLGIRRLYADAPTDAHRKYLERVGFEPVEDATTHEFERKI